VNESSAIGLGFHMQRLFLVLVAGLSLALAGTRLARAEFSVCNQTLDVVNVAIGHAVGKVFTTEGWWTIGANQCARVIRDDLQTRYIYVYADNVFGQPLLTGTTSMCIGTGKFTIEGVDQCWQRGHEAAKFLEVDTHEVTNWTLFLGLPSGG
jgi:uncharacterized membrane protein